MSPPNASLILIMVCFWVTLWLVHRYLIQPVSAVLADRRQRIDGAKREWSARNEEYLAAVARIEEQLQNAARDAGKNRADARQRAMDARQRALETARAQADERLADVVESLDKDAEAVRGELRRRAEELARLLAGRLLGREMAS
jgi:F0F1-type ATP synthase membrane subunit b/b'